MSIRHCTTLKGVLQHVMVNCVVWSYPKVTTTLKDIMHHHIVEGVIIFKVDFFNEVVIIFKVHQEYPKAPPYVWVQAITLQGCVSSSHNFHHSYKGTRAVKTSSVGPRNFSWLLHKARGFMSFFNHLIHARGPLTSSWHGWPQNGSLMLLPPI